MRRSRKQQLAGSRIQRKEMVKDLHQQNMLGIGGRDLAGVIAPYPARSFEDLLDQMAGDGLCRGCLALDHICDMEDVQDVHHERCLVPLARACQAAVEGKDIE